MGNHIDIVPLLFALIGSLWGFFVHANLSWRLGWLEWAVATPAFHHWHHTNDSPALIGTHYLPRKLPDAYGIDAKLPAGLGGQLLYPLRGKKAQPVYGEPVSAAE